MLRPASADGAEDGDCQCDRPRRPERGVPRPVAARRRLRAHGAGALVAGIAALLDWITVTFPDAPDASSPTERGVDLAEGSLVLALCVIALIAVLVTRVGAVDTSRRGAAPVVFLSGIALAGTAVGIVASADRRFVGDAIAEIAELGAIDADAAAFLEELLEVRLGSASG